MSILTEKNDEAVCLRLQGELDIAAAAELKTRLAEVLNSEKEIRVDLEQTADLDITALQLFHAAQRDAARVGIQFKFENVPEVIATLIADTGFPAF